ncbi:hypothetical protein VCHA51O444_10457 [Vibrio chagasii]|nr:hypothetical protein VCHA51O444_10457 [Vibrio chagasii]
MVLPLCLPSWLNIASLVLVALSALWLSIVLKLYATLSVEGTATRMARAHAILSFVLCMFYFKNTYR